MMITTVVRKFTDWEQIIITEICRSKSSGCTNMEELLCDIYFKEQYERALIIQSKRRYAVYFLSVDHFNDAGKKKSELEKFLEMISLIRWLKKQGYISLFRGDTSNEKIIHFLQDGFKNARTSAETIFLNAKGDYTSSPDTIHDKNKVVVYKGVIFEHDTYELILSATVGDLYIAPALIELAHSFSPAKDAISAVPENPKTEQPVALPAEEGDGEVTNNAPEETNNAGDTEIPISSPDEEPVRKKYKSWVYIMICAGLFMSFALSVFLYLRINKIEEQVNTVDKRQYDVMEIIRKAAVQDSLLRNPAVAVTEPEKDTSDIHYGIDLSHWNGDIVNDIQPVDSLWFAICKATQGKTGVDRSYEINWKLIKDKGLIGGKYHFYIVNDDPIAQAEHFYKIAGNIDSMDIPLIIDIEEASLSVRAFKKTEDIQKELLQCLQRVEQLSGRVPMIYTGLDFANTYLNNKQFERYPLWLAEYSGNASPRIPAVWKNKKYKIWQKTNRIDINSITVDYDVYYGTKKDLVNN
jgi:lysozyme